MQNGKGSIILIFGVFDLLHPGHRYIINEVLKLGSNLHICLASDEFVLEYKNKNTMNNFLKRKDSILKTWSNLTIHKGDNKIGQWSIFNQINPDIIVFGYDQLDLMKSIKKYLKDINQDVKYVVIPAYKPELYKTSLLA